MIINIMLLTICVVAMVGAMLLSDQEVKKMDATILLDVITGFTALAICKVSERLINQEVSTWEAVSFQRLQLALSIQFYDFGRRF